MAEPEPEAAPPQPQQPLVAAAGINTMQGERAVPRLAQVPAAAQVAAPARPDERNWEELAAGAPSALKWIMKSQLVLTCPESLSGVEANSRPRNYTMARMVPGERLVVKSDVPSSTDLYGNESAVQSALDHERQFDMLLFVLFWRDYETAISWDGLGKYLTGMLAIGIFIVAAATAEQDCSGIDQHSRFNVSGEPACEVIRFTKMDLSTKTEIPMTHQEARAACESAGPDGGGLCEYTRSPQGIWEDTQNQFYMALLALISIPLMVLLSFVDLWLREVLYPVLSWADPAGRERVTGSDQLENILHSDDYGSGELRDGQVTQLSTSFAAHRVQESSFDAMPAVQHKSTHNGKLPAEWVVLNVPGMTTPTPCFQQAENLNSLAAHALQLLFNNSAYMEPYRRQRQSQQSVLKRALQYVELYPKDPDAYDIFDEVEGLTVIVDYKWKMFARRRHLEQFRRLIWTMVLQRLLATPTAFGPVSELPIWEFAVMAALLGFSLSPTLNFCARLCVVEGWRNLLDVDSAASWVDVGWASSIAWDIVYTLYVGQSLHELEGKRVSSLQSWTLGLLWLRMFLFLIPFKVGRFVLMIVEITRKLKYFLVMLAFFILAFSDMMFEAQAADRVAARLADTEPIWRTYTDSWFSMYMFGVVGDPGGVTPEKSSQNQLTLSVIFILSSLVLTTVMLNMLIAIMTHVFDEAEDRADARLYLCRARLVLEYEAAMTPDELTMQQKSDYFPLYLHVLRPISYSQLQDTFDSEDGLKTLLRHWPADGATTEATEV